MHPQSRDEAWAELVFAHVKAKLHLLQAYGMGAYDALPVIFQRTSMLMLAHCVPITLVQLAVPELLRLAGEDPDLCRLASAYAIRLLPSLYIEAFSR